MINRIKNNEDISLYDGGEAYRDYLYVDDVVFAINLIINRGNVNDIYNVGSGIRTKIKDAVKYAKQETKSLSGVENIQTADFHKIVQTTNMVLDTEKLKALGFNIKYDIYDIIDILIND
jgi:nucleoside-diphosphate-sugar epimerase